MIIKEKTATGYVFENDYGETFSLTFSEANDIRCLLMIERLKRDIEDAVEEAEDDYGIDYDELRVSHDKFVGDVCSDLEYDVINNEYPSEEYIAEIIHDRLMRYKRTRRNRK